MIAIVVGTRPEFIKMSPIIKELQAKKQKFFIVHTGQHYDYSMNDVYFENLKIPKPKRHWGEEFCHATIDWMIDVFKKEKPEVVLVQGDTGSVFCGAIAALRCGIKIGHVEAGLRSWDWRMSEEHNRIMVDHVSDYCFAPTKIAVRNLLKEGIAKNKVFLVGNTIIDSVKENLANGSVCPRKKEEFILVTLHRAENTKNKEVLKDILEGISELLKKTGNTALFPIHPRTKKSIRRFGIKIPQNIRVVPPLPYLECLCVEQNARLIITDSGGVVEEACIFGTPCITVRKSTERPETVSIGANCLAGTSSQGIVREGLRMLASTTKWKHPYGQDVAKKIIRVLNYEGFIP